MISEHPLAKPFPTQFQTESDRSTPETGASYIVDPDYFHVMGISLLKGRQFTEHDTIESPVVIVNQTLASRFWPNQDPIGKHIIIPRIDRQIRWEIVGVAKDVRHYGINNDQRLQVYEPFLALPSNSMYLLVRTIHDPSSLVPLVQKEIWAIDRGIAVEHVETVKNYLSDLGLRPRLYMLLFTVFAALALIIAWVGLYGLMAYQVTLRTHEIGIRIALGAQGSHIIALVLKKGMMVALIGLSIGVAGGVALSSVLASFLYQVKATDPEILWAVSASSVAVALLASYIPALRAMKTDPIIALRHE
jgi:putative ABC transport system permease protein